MRANRKLLLATAAVGVCLVANSLLVAAAVGDRFRELFASLPGGERTLPPLTRIILGVGPWFERWWWAVALGTGALVAGCIALLATRWRERASASA